MTRRSIVWRVVAVAAVLFVLVNLYGAAIAAGRRELLHTGVHVGLLILGAFVISRLGAMRFASETRPAADQRIGARR